MSFFSKYLKKIFKTDTPHQKEEENIEHFVFCADDCMIRRGDFPNFYENESNIEKLKKITSKNFDSLPLCKGTIDDIVGSISVWDILNANFDENYKIKEKEVTFIPCSMCIPEILQIFSEKLVDLLVVVDDFGGTEGIITKKTVFDFILKQGDDKIGKEIDKGKSIIISGQDLLEDLEVDYGIKIFGKDDLTKTIGGFLVKNTGYFPKQGEIIKIGKYEFLIVESTNKIIKKISIKRI